MTLSSVLFKLAPKCLLMGFLFLMLSASSCRYIPQLQFWAEQDIDPAVNWYLAAKLGSADAAGRLIEYASETGQLHWLTLLAEMDLSDAQYYLGILTDNKSLRSKMLHQAANQDHVEALYEIGQSSHDNRTKTQSLTKASILEHRPSQYALYQWYWLQEEYELALPWLTKVAENHGQSALLLARYLWKSDSFTESKRWFAQAKNLGESEAKVYLSLIQHYWKKRASITTTPISPMVAKQCAMRLQFVANNLESIKQAEDFKRQFNADKRLSDLPICINKPVWLDQKQLGCKYYATNDYRITCDVSGLADIFEPHQFTHAVVFTEQGKANVNNGIMFLDLADQYSVFVHELAHFAGFIDEYPLSDKMAEQVCDVSHGYSNHTHPNIAIQKRSPQPAIQNAGVEQVFNDEVQAITTASKTGKNSIDLSYWQSFSNSIALIKARTCNNHPNQAYKFVGKLTFMEFHDQPFIPKMYLDIWRSRLNSLSYLCLHR